MDVKDSIRAYWHKRSETYDKFPAPRTESGEKASYSAVMKKFLNGNRLKVLDVGTGTGFMAVLLSEMGYEITGLDFAEGMLEKARRKAEENRCRINFRTGDAENLPFDDGCFDVVVSRYLLWTLPDPKRALAEWRRVTRDSGMIICIEGNWKDISLKGRLKRISRQMGILLYEKTNPNSLGYDAETGNKLPFRDGLTPEKVAELFRESGLTGIHTEMLTDVREAQARSMPVLYRLAMSPPTFLIKGERRDESS